MKLYIYALLVGSLSAQAQTRDARTSRLPSPPGEISGSRPGYGSGDNLGSRSIYLNGIDISSAKNQALNQVNLRIDAQGNVYIEAPQYDVQRETTFIPLGRQLPGGARHPEHRSPSPLTQFPGAPMGSNLSNKPSLASPSETGDTMKQQVPVPSGSVPSGIKEGTRTPPDATEDRSNPAAEIPGNPG